MNAQLILARKAQLLSRDWKESSGNNTRGKLYKAVPSNPSLYWIAYQPYDAGATVDEYGRIVDIWVFPWKPEHMEAK